jgi:hypothetical protein
MCMDVIVVTSGDPAPLNAAVPPTIIVSKDAAAPLAPATDPMEDIRVRAETVSSLLKDMMNLPPTRHWGINE